LNGRFQGLAADKRNGAATLFNDRYGMHRVYYHESKDAFYFAAEAKAILAVRPELRSLDQQSAGEFIACGCTMEGRSLFQGIRQLPPGAKWTFRNGSLAQKVSYFEPAEWENQKPRDSESYYRELREVFSRNLPRYFNGREPIAMSLTGGLDTRMIMAWQHSQPGSFPCYTFGGMFRECQDVSLSRRVATACGQSHQVITVGQEFLSRFSHYAERAVYLTDGCVDVSRAPDVYLNERARKIAPVRMTGNYGGEVLRHVRTFKPEERVPGLFQPEFGSLLHKAGVTYARVVQGHPVSLAVFKQNPWNHYGILAVEESQLSLRSPFLDNDLVRTVFRAPDSAFIGNEDSLRLIADGKKELLRIPTDRGLAGERGRFSEAAHRGVLEFLFKAEYAYDMGMPQSVAKMDHTLSAFHLERLFLGRHKVFHFRVWYRDALAEYVRDMMLDPRSLSRPYVERKGVEAVVRGHLKGDRNYTTDIHKLLALELTHRLFLD
jgi:asparagine synthase (glutamine-hydrolysing)